MVANVQDIGLYHHILAEPPLDRKKATSDFRFYVLDGNAPPTLLKWTHTFPPPAFSQACSVCPTLAAEKAAPPENRGIRNEEAKLFSLIEQTRRDARR